MIRKFLKRILGITEKELALENKEQQEEIKNCAILLKKIFDDCEYYKKQNMSISYAGFNKIQESIKIFTSYND